MRFLWSVLSVFKQASRQEISPKVDDSEWSRRSLKNNLRWFRWSWNRVWYVPANSNRRFEYPQNCGKICFQICYKISKGGNKNFREIRIGCCYISIWRYTILTSYNSFWVGIKWKCFPIPIFAEFSSVWLWTLT